EEVSCKKVDADGMLLDIAHLIDTKSIEKYQNRYSTAAKQLKNCQMVVTGPWPPYHFLPGKVRTVAGDS
ncbi:MAG: GvpL/GvpF family gas vesicle protein, partial [Terriglobales bacterium]